MEQKCFFLRNQSDPGDPAGVKRSFGYDEEAPGRSLGKSASVKYLLPFIKKGASGTQGLRNSL